MSPFEAMQRFLEASKPLLFGDVKTQYKSSDETIEEYFAFIAPFAANPERHKAALKAIIEGTAAQCMLVWVAPLFRLTGIMQKFGFGKIPPNLALIQRLESIRDDLLVSVDPGEFGVDILPPREKDDAVAEKRLIVFQVNVAVYPLADFVPQSLSVRLIALNDDIQFEDVNPASRIDVIGSYEIGVTDSGKFTETVKNTDKLAFKLDGQVAKIESELGGESSRSIESSTQLAIKQSRPSHAPLVISSALRNIARWELLRAPNQMLRGGSRFLATAFVPKELKAVTLEVRVRVELEKYGPHEVSTAKVIELGRPARNARK